MTELLRHIERCNNITVPGGRLPVSIGSDRVGWAPPETARVAASCGAVLDAAGLHVEPGRLPSLARALSERGLCRWRAEAFDVRSQPGGPVLATVDRGALPALGIQAAGVHLNGLVGDRLWVARRAADKALDPGKLDHVVAGGIPAGYGVEQTLEKEGAEEAGLPPDLARMARPVATIGYTMARPEGLRRDILYCYDLELPPEFRPEPRDGEVEAFELWDLDRVLDTMRRADDFKFNVNLVLIDLLIRGGRIAGAEADTLQRAMDQGRASEW